MAPSRTHDEAGETQSDSSLDRSRMAFHELVADASLQLPSGLLDHVGEVTFTCSDFMHSPTFPCPFQQTEAIALLKALESCAAAAIADARFGRKRRAIGINLDRCARFLLSGYLCTIGGKSKGDPSAKAKLKNTDLHQAQSNIYRSFSSNLYSTRNPGEFYHLHGSLEASTALQMIGLPAFNDDVTTHAQAVDYIEAQMRKFTVKELEELNQSNKQAGVQAVKHEDLPKTVHRGLLDGPLWDMQQLEDHSPPAPFAETRSTASKILEGIKVIEMCRVIAGPSITRILAEYGADVLKVTSPTLSDVPWWQVEGNMGKHATDLDLQTPRDREVFESLLADADVLVDGYRHGALERLGYGPEVLSAMAKKRGKGIVYVSENCFGFGKFADRPGWQPIADCVSGVAWEQGRFMGLDEPVIPPFPMSDYGTGLMGAITALIGLHQRATNGGSYHTKVSLVKYEQLLFRLGPYSERTQRETRRRFAGPFFDLNHASHTDVVSSTCLETMKNVIPGLFKSEESFMEEWWSDAYGAKIKVVQQVADIEGLTTGYERASRPNGTDMAVWDGWETDDPLRRIQGRSEVSEA